MASKRKMTAWNYGRLCITGMLLGITIWTGRKVHFDSQFFAIHIFYAVTSLVLLIRTIYSYLKGE
jgi:hypothetical protein